MKYKVGDKVRYVTPTNEEECDLDTSSPSVGMCGVIISVDETCPADLNYLVGFDGTDITWWCGDRHIEGISENKYGHINLTFNFI